MNILGDLDPRDGEAATPQNRPGESSECNSERNRPQAVGGVENVTLEDSGKRSPSDVGACAGTPLYPDEWNLAPQPHSRAKGLLYGLVIALVMGVLGGLAYGYYALRAANVSIAQIPDLLDSVHILKGRMVSVEDRLRNFATSQGQLSARLGALDGRVNTNLQEAHRETEEQIAQAEGRVSREMNQKNHVLDSRLTHVEQNQTDDRAQLAQLNQQLEQQVATLKGELARTQEGTRRGLQTLDAQLGQSQQGLQDLGQKLHRQKVTFEVPTKAPTEIVPGISLTILKTNTSRQRFQGYVSLAAEGRTLWLDNLGLEESLDLFPRGAIHPYSLVITYIASNEVAGYLLLPARA